jgi:hypothetical protein
VVSKGRPISSKAGVESINPGNRDAGEEEASDLPPITGDMPSVDPGVSGSLCCEYVHDVQSKITIVVVKNIRFMAKHHPYR